MTIYEDKHYRDSKINYIFINTCLAKLDAVCGINEMFQLLKFKKKVKMDRFLIVYL